MDGQEPKPADTFTAKTPEEVAAELGVAPEVEDRTDLPVSLQEMLRSEAPYDVKNRTLYEQAAKSYRKLEKLRQDKGMREEDLALWADAQNPMRVAEFSTFELTRLSEIRRMYDLQGPDNSGYSISDGQRAALPLRVQEILRDTSGRPELSQDIVFSAASKLTGLKAGQTRSGMSDSDLKLWAEAVYPMSLAKYTQQQRVRLAEVRS